MKLSNKRIRWETDMAGRCATTSSRLDPFDGLIMRSAAQTIERLSAKSKNCASIVTHTLDASTPI